MKRCSTLGPRFVGDPVDVVTGEVRDIALDFQLGGRRPFVWERDYQSFRAARDLVRPRFLAEGHGLGPGHRHGLDWRLHLGFDGVGLETPHGRVQFPHLRADGDDARRDGWRLVRVTPLVHRLTRSGEPMREFTRTDLGLRDLRLFRIAHDDGGITNLQYRNVRGFEIEVVRDTQGWTLTFSWEDHRVRRIDAHGSFGTYAAIRYEYDERGLLRTGFDAYRHRFQWAYDASGRVVRRADRRGYAFVYDYDERGRCLRAAGEDDVDAVLLTYSAAGCETKVIHEANGATWWYRFLPDGNLQEIEDPHGGKRSFLRDEEGNLLAQIDAVGDVWKVERDPLGVETGLLDPLGYHHPPNENPNAPEIDPLLHDVPGTALEQEHGRLHPLGFDVPVRWVIDAAVPPAVATTLIPAEYAGIERDVRDPSGLLLRKEKHYGDGQMFRKTFVYDPAGNLQKVRDYDGGDWVHTYASWNQRTSTRNPLGHVTHFVTGKRDKLLEVHDPNHVQSTYEWDLCDRLTAVRRHGRIRERYVLNLAGGLVAKRNANDEAIVSYERGPLGTLLRRTCKDALETFERDHAGRITAATRTTRHDSNTIHREYDALGECRADTRDGAGVWHDVAKWTRRITIRTRARDKDGRGPAFVIRYRTTAARTLEITDPTGRVHRVRVVAPGILERRFTHGLVETSQYDGEGRCLARVSEGPRGLWRRRFVWSPAGDLLYREDDQRGPTEYAHDLAHRVTAVTHPDGRVDPYEYDAGDNLLHKPGLAEGLLGEQVAKDSGNRLYQANDDRFDYDFRDHVRFRHGPWGNIAYVRDHIGRLLGVLDRDRTGELESALLNDHDALGRRVRKRWKRGNEETVTEFFWDGDRLAAEVLPGGQLRIYVYEHEDALVPMLAIEYASVDAAPEDGRVLVLQTDHRGAIEHVEDEDGNTPWDADIGPFGEATLRGGEETFHQPFRLVGQYHDPETGLSGHRYRNWSPELGRFLESDPLGLAGGLNLYAWPGNPLRTSDPLGLHCTDPNCVDPTCPTHSPTRDSGADAADIEHIAGWNEYQQHTRGQFTSRTDAAAAYKQLKAFERMRTDMAADIDLASRPGSSPDQRAARLRVAERFYRDVAGNANPASELRGIDFDHPIVLGPSPPPPSPQSQWSAPGAPQGQYYADKGVEPTHVGINPEGRGLGPDGYGSGPDLEDKVSTQYDVHPASPYLESTAAPVDDTWSDKVGPPYPTQGGARQRFIPRATGYVPKETPP